MFATLAGAFQRPPVAGSREEAVREYVSEQDAAGLEPVVEGCSTPSEALIEVARGLRGLTVDGAGTIRATSLPAWTMPIIVDRWAFAASATTRAVKQAIPGPYTLGRAVEAGRLGRSKVTLALAEALGAELRALAVAGCPLVQIDEPGAVAIGDDGGQRSLFLDAQRRMLDGVEGTHLSLAITGGSADTAGAATILDPPYHSLLVDLIEGPDNWRLVAAAPGDRGIVCGAMDARTAALDEREILVWAARYAASTNGRGLVRVGLATSGDLVGLSRVEARAKIERLGETALLLATKTGDELLAELDPRSINARSAALGQFVPAMPPRRARRLPRSR
jgi:methionine synthase II (cobalamin-independent)